MTTAAATRAAVHMFSARVRRTRRPDHNAPPRNSHASRDVASTAGEVMCQNHQPSARANGVADHTLRHDTSNGRTAQNAQSNTAIITMEPSKAPYPAKVA